MKGRKISDIVTAVLFLCVIFGFAAGFAAMPDRDSDSFETGLQRLPNLTAADNEYKGLDYVLHGELADDFDEYFCDQFPLRKSFVTLKAALEALSFRAVNNGVLYTGGRLATVRFDSVGTSGNTEEYGREHVAAMTESLKTACENAGVPTRVLLPPRTIDVIAPESGYPTAISDELNAQVKTALGGLYIDVLPKMREMDARGELPYFRTDHHWSASGALAAYGEVMRAFGGEPVGGVKLETVSDDFCGTSCRNGNFFFVGGDKLQIFDIDGRFKVEAGAKLDYMAEKDGLYDYGALDSVDKYNVFLHGKAPYMRITKPDEKRETLLVLKDSFAHSLVPLLAQHYDVVTADIDLLINPALGTGIDLKKLVSDIGADRVLIVYNLQNVIENENLGFVR